MTSYPGAAAPDPALRSPAAADPGLYRTLWRWHFYAGLFVLPFILALSVTGSIYLFKPQIDRWEERAFHNLPTADAVSADQQLAAVMAAKPGARFDAFRLPERPGDAAMVQVELPNGATRQVFVAPGGTVLGTFDPATRLSDTVSRIHGSLLLGRWGDWLVELAASWTIILLLSGLYLWWPRPFRAAGTLWPRLRLRGRPLLKDLHRVTGFWIAGLVLLMLVSGLPWAGVWGTALRTVRTELGALQGTQDWKVGAADPHAGHHGAMQPGPAMHPPMTAGLPLSAFVARAQGEHMAFPVLVLPPHAPQRFGPPTGDVWTVKSEAQNRPLDRQVTYNPATGAQVGRKDFADQPVVDRVVNTGVAWHEGQLFGWANQLLGLLTAIALVATSVLGVLTWLRRRPAGSLGAPPPGSGARRRGLVVAVVIAGLLLPLFGLSVLVLALLDLIGRRFFGHDRPAPVN